jgi:aspartate kinase
MCALRHTWTAPPVSRRTRLSLSSIAQVAAHGDIVVMKFGGTSVAAADDIRRAAGRIVAARENGRQVVAVLSARGKTTDDLLNMAYEVSDRPLAREMDMLLSTGERISCALCAMAIHDMGHSAISLTGSQAGIVTDSSHTQARILDVRADRIREALGDDRIVLVAGFQGVSGDSRDITTLGRGGSDTTAVAIAAALGADVCEIYTDVRGVFSADPRLVPDARLLSVVSFEEMLEMAASGAKVLQLRSVEYARNFEIPIHCRSSFEDGPGTLVVSEKQTMERPSVTAVTHADEARVTLTGVRDEPGVAAQIFGALAGANVNVDMIIQNEPVSADQKADLSFTVDPGDLKAATEALDPLEICERLGTDERIGKVSIVGAGMRSHPGVAAKVFQTLGEGGINIEMISTSPIKISCVIAADEVPAAVKALHRAFELGDGAIRREEPTGEEHRPVVRPDEDEEGTGDDA